MKRACWISPIALAVFAVWIGAQPAGRFDAVSIKRNLSELPNSETSTSPGRLSLENVTPLSILMRAFGVQEFQIIGAPGWASSERYDLLAVTGGADRLTDRERQPFLQLMLAERWQFRFHRENRDMSVYSLEIDRGGPKLQIHSGPGVYGMKVSANEGRLRLTSTKGNIPRLVEILSRNTGKIVVNDTGLDGEYDFTLEWVQDLISDAAGPSLTTALRDQLGLRLQSVKQPVEAIVVDHIDRPSEN